MFVGAARVARAMRGGWVLLTWGLLGIAASLQANCLPGDGSVVHARYQVSAGDGRYLVQMALPSARPDWLVPLLGGEEIVAPPMVVYPQQAVPQAPALFAQLLEARGQGRGREMLERAGFQLKDGAAGVVLGCPVQVFVHASGEDVLWVPAVSLPVRVSTGRAGGGDVQWQLSYLERRSAR